LDTLRTRLDQLLLYCYRQVYGNRILAPFITNQFYKLYYASSRRTWHGNTTWFGTQLLKNPFDMWVYQELIHRIQPDAIIECGTYNGGSARYFASLCDLLDNGKILTIDIEEREGRPQHERVTYYRGSSIANETMDAEMRLYGQFVTDNSYMIVEDGCVNGHPVLPFYGPGPLEAIRLFLKEDDTFEIDKACEKFYFTFNPSGYLRKLPSKS